jgi:hypothetical protein
VTQKAFKTATIEIEEAQGHLNAIEDSVGVSTVIFLSNASAARGAEQYHPDKTKILCISTFLEVEDYY